jgi:hypothetical protein
MNAHLLYMAHDTVYAKTLYADFVKDLRDYYSNPAVTEEQVWQDVILAWRATYEADKVVAKYESFGPYPYRFDYAGGAVTAVVWNNPGLDNLNDPPPAHFYHWIHAIDSLGHVNSGVLANYSSYGVFDNGPCRHYVMYNPPGSPTRTVDFSDGRSWFLPEDTTITYKWCPAPLPVRLLNFEAEKSGDHALLTWSTSQEMNNDYFQIQRSEDGIHFSDIGKVSGKGTTTSTQYYSYIDEKPFQGPTYYRLKQVDYDGKWEYSPIRVVFMKGTWLVYPKPTTDNIHIIAPLLSEGNNTYSLFSIEGQELESGTFSGQKTLDLSTYSAGFYVLVLKDSKGDAWIEKIPKE